MEQNTEMDPRILDEIEQLIYIADMDTHELLFINRLGCQVLGCKDEYIGRKCYEFLQGETNVCSYCKNNCLKSDGSAYQWYHYNEKIGRYLELQDRMIQFHGHRARIETAVDITERENRYQQLTNTLAEQKMVTSCDRTLNGNNDLDERINQCLQEIGQYYHADRAYLFKIRDDRKSMDNTYEWCRSGVKAEINDLKNVDIKEMTRWMAPFNRRETVVVDNIESIREISVDEYKTMKRQEIYSYLEAPLYAKEELYGFLGVDNPDPLMIKNSAESFLALAYSFANAFGRDAITGRLVKEQKRYETTVEGAGIGLWEYRIKEHRIIHANQKFKDLGFPDVLEDVPGCLLPYFREDGHEKLLNMYDRIAKGSDREEEYFWIRWKPLELPRCEHIIYIAQKDRHGEPESAYGIAIDVTAQKLEQEKFHVAMKEMLTGNPDALTVIRVNLTKNLCEDVHTISSVLTNALQAKTFDGLAAKLAALMPTETEQKEFLKVFNKQYLIDYYLSERNYLQLEYQRYGEKNKLFWIRAVIRMIRNPETNDIEGVLYSLDITREKQLNEILRTITDREYDLIVLVHMEDRSVEAVHLGASLPDEYREILPAPGKIYPLSSFRKDAMEKWVNPEDLEKYRMNSDPAYYLPIMERDGSSEFTIRETFKHKGETYRRFQHYYLGDDKDTILVIESDVTETYRRQQDELSKERELRNQAMAANAAKTDFLSRMSHDIRTPLNGIIGMSYLAQQKENSVYTADCLDKISTSAKFLLDLINNILDMSKIESGRIDFHLEPYPINELNDYLDAVIQPLCNVRNQIFIREEDVVPGQIPLADKNYTNQIIFNLLSNAIKFTPEGGTITYRIRSRQISDHRVRIEHYISDTGIGISEEFQKHIFEAFSQEDRNDISDERGSGLGLAIVKKLVDLMHGTISVSSTVGKGTSFTVQLVFDTISEETTHQVHPAEDQQEDLKGLAGKRILLCEDHPLNQQIAKALLGEAGIHTDIAENGESGVKRFAMSAIHYYDAILMDIRMPVMDGYEATRRIRALKRADAAGIPIIAMTADAFEESIEAAKEAGMTGYITKPLDPVYLFRQLSGMMKIKK